MGLPALQLAADLLQEHGLVLLYNELLPLFGGLVRVPVLQLLGGEEGHLPAQLGGELGELPLQLVQGAADGADDALYRVFQGGLVPGGLIDDLLPIPLVHVDGVEVIQLLVPADGVHVRHQAVAHEEIVVFQGQALPLGQGVHHLGVLPHGGHVEADGALHAVQVVVEARGRVHKQGRGDPLEVQRGAQLYLEDIFDEPDGFLGLVQAQGGLVVFRDDGHTGSPSLQKYPSIIPDFPGFARISASRRGESCKITPRPRGDGACPRRFSPGAPPGWRPSGSQ